MKIVYVSLTYLFLGILPLQAGLCPHGWLTNQHACAICASATNSNSGSGIITPAEVERRMNQAKEDSKRAWDRVQEPKPKRATSSSNHLCSGCGSHSGCYPDCPIGGSNRDDNYSKCYSCGANWKYGVYHFSSCPTQKAARDAEIARLEQEARAAEIARVRDAEIARLEQEARQRKLAEEELKKLEALKELKRRELKAFAGQNYLDKDGLSALSASFSGDTSRYDEGYSVIPSDVKPYIYDEFLGDPGDGDVRITFSESGIPKALSPGQITDLPVYKRREDGILVRQVLGKPVNGIIPRPKDFSVDSTSQDAWLQNQKYGKEKMSFAEFKARQYKDNADGRDQAVENALDTMDRLQKEGKVRMSITEQNAVEAIMRSRLEDIPLSIQMDAVNATKIQLVLDAAKAQKKPTLTPPEADLPSPQEVEAMINLNK